MTASLYQRGFGVSGMRGSAFHRRFGRQRLLQLYKQYVRHAALGVQPDVVAASAPVIPLVREQVCHMHRAVGAQPPRCEWNLDMAMLHVEWIEVHDHEQE